VSQKQDILLLPTTFPNSFSSGLSIMRVIIKDSTTPQMRRYGATLPCEM